MKGRKYAEMIAKISHLRTVDKSDPIQSILRITRLVIALNTTEKNILVVDP